MSEQASKTIVERIDLGRLDAESDKNLPEYFLDTGTVDLVRQGKQLVVGRKGAGKTALFTFLATELDPVIELDLDDYVWQFHRGLAEVGLQPERAFTTSWKLLIYLSAYSAIRDRLGQDGRKRADGALKALGLGADRGRIKAMVDWLARVRRVDMPEVVGVFSGGGFEVADPAEGNLSAEATRAIHELEDVLVEARQKIPFTVMIDRLDDAWDGSEESLNMIAGAVRATREAALTLDGPPPAPVVTFLRTDLWDRISFNDRNKMSQDILFLDWSTDELADVVALRIARSLETRQEEAWATAFTTEEMRQRASARTYMTKRALGRPRDIVAFAIFAREEAQRSGNDVIEASDIYDAEQRFLAAPFR